MLKHTLPIQNCILLYYSDGNILKGVCIFIAYFVTDFDTIPQSHILTIFMFTANGGK